MKLSLVLERSDDERFDLSRFFVAIQAVSPGSILSASSRA